MPDAGLRSLPLRVSNVTKRFGGVTALSDVSLSLGPGEVLGLLGANGAGKSTLLDIIGGEQAADAGEAQLNGRALHGPPEQRARLGLSRTFQRPKVSPDLTVLENVAAGLAVRELAGPGRILLSTLRAIFFGRLAYKDAAENAGARVGLHDLARDTRALSLGELRLLEIARALTQEPQVMLLDEPFPGLEDEDVRLVSTAIRSLASDGRSVLLVDHNLPLVQGLVDRVVLLAGGQVAFTGTVADCLASDAFQKEYVGRRRPQ
jgi:branched-chain amino acid transport system ATP-binding protein